MEYSALLAQLGTSLELSLGLCEVIALSAQIAQQALEDNSKGQTSITMLISAFADASLVMSCFLCLTLFMVKFAVILG